MGDITGIRNLNTRQRKFRICRPKAEKQHIHLLAIHNILQIIMNLRQTGLFIRGVQRGAQIRSGAKKILGISLIPGLVIESIKMDCMAFNRKRAFLSLFYGFIPNILLVPIGIIADID